MARPHNTKKIKDLVFLQVKVDRQFKQAFENKVIEQGATISGKIRALIKAYLEASK